MKDDGQQSDAEWCMLSLNGHNYSIIVKLQGAINFTALQQYKYAFIRSIALENLPFVWFL